PLQEREVARLGVQLAEGLAAAHEQRVVHRDLKPANLRVTPDGRLKILDFGLAKLVRPDVVSATATTESFTETQGVAGTLPYMAPEQLRGEGVDHRTDIWAAGVVLYEMATGRHPFEAKFAAALAADIQTKPPVPPSQLNPKSSRRLEEIILKCLEKEPEHRYPAAKHLQIALAAYESKITGREVGLRALLRQPKFAIPTILLTLAVVVSAVWFWVQQSHASWARTEALPEAARLIGQGKIYAAFRLLRRAEAYVPDDPILKQMLLESTTPVTVRTTPAGADVYVRDFFDEPDAWEFLGSAPLDELRLPTATLVFKISREGFETRELLAFTLARTLGFSLQPAGEVPPNMVHVPGGRYELFSTPVVELDDYWVDKYEVTNRQFETFVDRGGYEKREYWTERFVKDGVVLSWEEARQVFRDRTGRPGPATWELSTYPDGEDDYAVGGVSWYEAVAYCASVDKQLPTVYHWYNAADLGGMTEFARFGNFQTDGPAKVGHPLRLGVNGTYDMAGNIKEWVWNQADLRRRYILGAGWNEPSYYFHDYDAQRPFDRQATYGFRCAKYGAPLPASQTDRIAQPFRDYRQETPVPDEVFAVYKSLYRYDRTPLDGRVESIDDSFEHWRVDRVSFTAAYGNERVPALLFLPKNARPPYQTVVYFPGANAFLQRSSSSAVDDEGYWFLFLVRSGRAVLFPIYKGTYERSTGYPALPHVWRDIMIHSAKDLGRALDYLETRADIDARKLAYYGLSMGAGVGPIMTAVEPRFRASILLGGGLYFWRRPPESEAFNFLLRVTVPTLMINGRHDFFFQWETSQAPMFKLLGTPPADKRHRIFESGHIPTEQQEVIKEILDWLDQHLGPVG
ncbi:MAG: protein kinase, partial [Phycisphaerae bacterium]